MHLFCNDREKEGSFGIGGVRRWQYLGGQNIGEKMIRINFIRKIYFQLNKIIWK